MTEPTAEEQINLVYDLTVANPSFGPESEPALRHEVIDMIRTGWTPARIVRYLLETLGVTIPITHVVEFRAALPEAALVPPGKLATRLKRVDLEIDAMGELARAIRISEDRLDTALTLEEATGHPAKETTSLLEQYAQLLQKYLELKMRMGLIPEEPKKLDLTSDGESLAPTLREVYDRVQRAGPELSDSAVTS